MQNNKILSDVYKSIELKPSLRLTQSVWSHGKRHKFNFNNMQSVDVTGNLTSESWF